MDKDEAAKKFLSPYYDDGITRLWHERCIDGMEQILPPDIGDVLVTSPPYNVGKEYERLMPFGDYLKLISDMYVGAYRVIKPGGYAVVNYSDYYIFEGGNTSIQPMTYLHNIISE